MKPLIVIAGPTAVGKSDMAVKLAKKINGEIISADSMQVYKGMDIGSAKITKEEMDGVTHHLIDILNPDEEFNISTFQEMALKACNEIYSRGRIPIVAGGTGFYIQSLIYEIDFTESSGEISEYRKEIEKQIEEEGIDCVYAQLKSVDPVTCETIHKNDYKRVIRALEFYKETNTPISRHNETQRNNPPRFDFCYFVLTDERPLIYERINSRVDKMIDRGLVDEVKHLKDSGLSRNNLSMQGLGYKEILDYLDGKITLDEAVYIIKRDSRHFAKRQLTWYKREKDVIWVDKKEFDYNDDAILEYMIKTINERIKS